MEDWWFWVFLVCLIVIGARLTKLEQAKLSKKEKKKLADKQKENNKIVLWILLAIVAIIVIAVIWLVVLDSSSNDYDNTNSNCVNQCDLTSTNCMRYATPGSSEYLVCVNNFNNCMNNCP